jgi:hypothetical protein
MYTEYERIMFAALYKCKCFVVLDFLFPVTFRYSFVTAVKYVLCVVLILFDCL